MQFRRLADAVRYRTLDTAGLRDSYLVQSLFVPGKLELVGFDADRSVVGAAMPTTAPLSLEAPPELRAATFCERREVGIINIGGAGKVAADAETFHVRSRECVYVGRGTKKVTFESDSAAEPAAFYLVSFTAHATFPTRHATVEQATTKKIGTAEGASVRTLRQYIHMDGIRSCQLVMGYTEIEAGSVWNTQPPHTHERRCEIYMYFDLPADGRIMHFMGLPEETRVLVLADRDVVASPPWSMHFGAGTGAYRFVWAMGGENQAFDDMDHVPMTRVR